MCTRTEGICTPVVSRVCEHTVCCWTSVSGLVVLTPLTAIWERCRYRYGAGPNSHAAPRPSDDQPRRRRKAAPSQSQMRHQHSAMQKRIRPTPTTFPAPPSQNPTTTRLPAFQLQASLPASLLPCVACDLELAAHDWELGLGTHHAHAPAGSSTRSKLQSVGSIQNREKLP